MFRSNSRARSSNLIARVSTSSNAAGKPVSSIVVCLWMRVRLTKGSKDCLANHWRSQPPLNRSKQCKDFICSCTRMLPVSIETKMHSGKKLQLCSVVFLETHMPGGMTAVHDLFWSALALWAFGNLKGGRSGFERYISWCEEGFAHDFSEVGAMYRSYAPICCA